MGGRGRGRGRGGYMSHNNDLTAKNDAIVFQPPQKFPPLEYKPLPLNITKEMEHIVQLKREFLEYMRESKNNVAPVVVKKDIERYSDRYQYLDGSYKKSYESSYDWTRMPNELKSTAGKRKKDKNSNAKKPKVEKDKSINIEKKLQELESKENGQSSDGDEEENNEEDEDDEDKDINKPIDGEDEDLDEEMDEGTDYVNSYFDNGEGYDDDDDNMDDGPIY